MTYAPRPPAKIGDRIKLLRMAPDFAPIPNGATGTVRTVVSLPLKAWQLGINWDAPHEERSLSLLYPEDNFQVIPA